MRPNTLPARDALHFFRLKASDDLLSAGRRTDGYFVFLCCLLFWVH